MDSGEPQFLYVNHGTKLSMACRVAPLKVVGAENTLEIMEEKSSNDLPASTVCHLCDEWCRHPKVVVMIDGGGGGGCCGDDDANLGKSWNQQPGPNDKLYKVFPGRDAGMHMDARLERL